MTAAARKIQVRRAAFDPATAKRRSMLAKIHVAVKQLQLADDDYRAILFRVTGESSAANCTEAGLQAVLDDLKRLGFQAKARAAQSRPADHPGARKARALWISLFHLGAFNNPSERALEEFAKRQLKCERLQWADQGQMFKLVEALKAIALRHGWDATAPSRHDPSQALITIKMRLVEVLLAKLKDAELAPREWHLSRAAERIAGFDRPWTQWSLGDFDTIARVFGDLLRNGKRTHS